MIYVIDNCFEISSALSDEWSSISLLDDEAETIDLRKKITNNIVLLHYSVKESETANYIVTLQAMYPAINIVVTGHNLADKQIIQCLFSGAIGYQNLSELAVVLKKMIAVINAGEAWISRKLIAQLSKEYCITSEQPDINLKPSAHQSYH